MNWSRQTAATGTTPWCLGVESVAASGWVGTDWIENILLRQSGAKKYDDWYNGKLSWTDDRAHHELRGRRHADVRRETRLLPAPPSDLHQLLLREEHPRHQSRHRYTCCATFFLRCPGKCSNPRT
jgi:hypothetical protein